MDHKILEDLRSEFSKGNVLFVVGAGVSILSSGAPTSSWKGLLKDGINRVAALGRSPDSTIARILQQIDSDDLIELLGAATFVSQKLGGASDGEFGRWLTESVGSLSLREPAAIEALSATGAILLTTNYDGLIEQVTGLSPITWQNIDRCERTLRGDEAAVIHIHGYWQSPETVILGQDSYALIAKDERVQSFIRAAHLAKTFVYVGVGAGLGDPNFSQFLQWSETYFSGSQTRRYRLVRENEVELVAKEHRPGQRIQVLSYGKSYADIVPFLDTFRQRGQIISRRQKVPTPRRTLLRNSAPESRFELRGIDWYDERDASFLHGRDGDIDRLKQLLAAYPVVRLVAPSGTGKSSLLRAGLVPALRKLGWRSIVVRPYDDPSSIMAGEISHMILNDRSEPFRDPIDNYTLRAELAPLLEEENCPCLVLIIDQTEDIFSPSAAANSKTWLRDLLRELYRCRDAVPLLKVVVSYRTDAEAQLGRIWQEASSNPAGFPYHSLLGLTIEDAEMVIAEVAARLEWKLEVSPRDLAAELRLESRSTVEDTVVFPPYLQILLATIATERNKAAVDSAFIQHLGGVRGIIATYLRRVVDELERRGGDYQFIRAILQAVCRSSGEKLRQTSTEIAESARVSHSIASVLLTELVAKRLVRPIGGDSYEIQHDRLAEVIVAELDPTEKESKQATELLLSKAASFDTTRAYLTEGELQLLFRHRAKLPLRDATERLLITSTLQVYNQRARPPVGWIWMHSKTVKHVIEQFIATGFEVKSAVRKAVNTALGEQPSDDIDFLIHLAANNVCNLRDGALLAIQKDSNSSHSAKLRSLLKHSDDKLRRAAALALRSRTDNPTRKLLREAAKSDIAYGVRRAAMEALGKPLIKADVEVLRAIAVKNKGEQAKRAVELLGENITPTSLTALRSLAFETPVRSIATRLLLQQPSDADELAEKILRQDDWRLKAILAEESTSLEILSALATHRAETVWKQAVKSIGRLKTDEAYEWLVGELDRGTISPISVLLNAIATSGHPDALNLLISIAESDLAYAENAISAIPKVGTIEAATYLFDQSTEWEPEGNDEQIEGTVYDPDENAIVERRPPTNPWHADIVAAIKAIQDKASLPELRGWSKSPVVEISVAAIETYASLSDFEDRTWMFDLLSREESVQEAVLEATRGAPVINAAPFIREFGNAGLEPYRYYRNRFALQKFFWSQRDGRSVPALREISSKSQGLLRALALTALCRFSDPLDIPLFLKTVSDSRDESRLAALEGLMHYDDPRVKSVLRSLILRHGEGSLDAVDVFCAVGSDSEKRQLLEECVGARLLDVAGILDHALNAPTWWPKGQ